MAGVNRARVVCGLGRPAGPAAPRAMALGVPPGGGWHRRIFVKKDKILFLQRICLLRADSKAFIKRHGRRIETNPVGQRH
jgi:hypothetical protein